MSEYDAETLTEREQEVARLMASGLTNPEIAQRLGISFGTAKWHVSQVLAKTGARRRDALSTRMRTQGWLGIPVAKLLAITAAALPVAVVTASAGIILWQRHLAPEGPASLAEQAALVQASTPAAGNRPAGQSVTPAHNCNPRLTFSRGSVTAADHSGCDFSGFDFGSAYLNQANLTGANLTGAVFNGATLGGADLSSVNAQRANFHSSILQNAKFDGADLTGADFADSIVTGATFHGAICPDGLPAATRGDTCVDTPGLRNLPSTRSIEASRRLVGLAAAGFSLPDRSTAAATVVSTADYAGRPLVLWWFASWCGQCQAQAAELGEAERLHPGLAVVPLSIDQDAVAAAAMLEHAGFHGSWAQDVDNLLAADYGVVAVSGAVVVDADGIYRGLEFPNGPGEFTELLKRAGVLP